uniref:BUD13 homolog n=1 Tax=Caenorhabditis japonica TaxID=281687 RepID=A0A8R1HMW5_CAEJA
MQCVRKRRTRSETFIYRTQGVLANKGHKTENREDESPPRRRNRRNSDSSPPRRPRRQNSDDDLSPPRKNRKIEEPKKIKKEEPDSDTEKTLDGKRSGLQSAKDLKEESDRLRAKNEKMFEDMDSAVSGRFADTVHRQKQTKKKGKDSEEDQAKKEREAKKTEELKQKYKSWNRGVAQIEERREQLEEMARVAAEPMARARDDDAMNAHLKEVLHAADPMAAMIHKKRRDTAIDRGEVVYPTYQGPWTPNRFGIAPGHRWDGVDR